MNRSRFNFVARALSISAISLLIAPPTLAGGRAEGAPSPKPLVWEQSHPVGPRTGSTLVTNPLNGHILMFGGGMNGLSGGGSARTAFGDFWEWDGHRWTNVQCSGPSPRFGAAAAIDPRTGYLLLHGGQGMALDPSSSLSSRRADTWQWDGARWEQLSVVGPTFLFSNVSGPGLSMAFDQARNEMVLDVRGESYLPDTAFSTWVWTGAGWDRRDNSEPGEWRTEIAFDVGVQRLVAFQVPTQAQPARTVEWTGSDWVATATPDPTQFYAVKLFGDPANGRVFAIATSADAPTRGLWERQSGAWVRLSDSLSMPLNEYVSVEAAWDGVNQRPLAHGGDTILSRNYGTWLLDAGQWRLKTPTGPGGRPDTNVVYDPIRQLAVLFGSVTTDFNINRGDTWEYDGEHWQRRATSQQPVPITTTSPLHFDNSIGQVSTAALTSASRGTWDWDGTAWTQRTTNTPPSRRAGAARAFHSGIGKLVVHGGAAANDPSSLNGHTWLLSGSEWTELDIPGPAGRYNAMMAYDEHRQRIVMFGGTPTFNAPTVPETWEFDGKSWAQVAINAGPPATLPGTEVPATFGGMTYDPIRRVVVLLQGPRATYLTATAPDSLPTLPSCIWEWNGDQWCKREVTQTIGAVNTLFQEPNFSGFRNPQRFLATRLGIAPGFLLDAAFAFDGHSGRVALWSGRFLPFQSTAYAAAHSTIKELSGPTVVASPPRRIFGVAGFTLLIEGRIATVEAQYHWEKFGGSIPPAPRALGEFEDGLMLRDLQRQDSGVYRLTATVGDGSISTETCEVIVRSRADFDGDGAVNSKDLVRLISVFGQQTPNCIGFVYDIRSGCLEDLNTDGTINTKDLTRFLGEMARWNTPVLQD